MSDIEDELLALAGGDSDDQATRPKSRDASASPPPVKKDSKRAKRPAAKDDVDGDEEEGEA